MRNKQTCKSQGIWGFVSFSNSLDLLINIWMCIVVSLRLNQSIYEWLSEGKKKKLTFELNDDFTISLMRKQLIVEWPSEILSRSFSNWIGVTLFLDVEWDCCFQESMLEIDQLYFTKASPGYDYEALKRRRASSSIWYCIIFHRSFIDKY